VLVQSGSAAVMIAGSKNNQEKVERIDRKSLEDMVSEVSQLLPEFQSDTLFIAAKRSKITSFAAYFLMDGSKSFCQFFC
jgi:hypothetical protein